MSSSWLHGVIHWMQAIQHAGWSGWLWFIALYALACLTFVPGSILTVGAGAIYGFWFGSALVLAGNGLGSVLSLLIARFFLHDWVARKLANHPKMKLVEAAVQRDGWKIVLLTRLSPIMPFSLINYALGLTDISAGKFLLAVVAGAMPSTFVYVYLGTLVGNLARIGPELKQHRPLEWALQGGGLIFTVVMTVYVTRLATRALQKKEEEKE